MSYQEKKTIVSTITGIIILTAYCTYAHERFRSGMIASGDVKYWAETMLIFIGIGIASSIVIQIIFHILLSMAIAVKEQITNHTCNETDIDRIIKIEMVEDEMDKLIGLKSMRISFAVAGIGFVTALAALVFNYSPVVMLNIMFVSFSTGSLAEGIAQLYFYRKGVTNG
jgi:hypothetical protein